MKLSNVIRVNFSIKILKEGTIMMGGLQKVGWVVLKSGFNIKPHSVLENALYDVNIDVPSDKLHWFGIVNIKKINCFTNNH